MLESELATTLDIA